MLIDDWKLLLLFFVINFVVMRIKTKKFLDVEKFKVYFVVENLNFKKPLWIFGWVFLWRFKIHFLGEFVDISGYGNEIWYNIKKFNNGEKNFE